MGLWFCELVVELKCSREEADTRMFFHATDAAHNGFVPVCLSSPDTDVMEIRMYLASQVPAQIILLRGKQHRSCYTDPSAIAEKQGACRKIDWSAVLYRV